MYNSLLVVIAFLVIFELQPREQSIPTSGLYEIIYEADKGGNRISGSLEGLANYVDQGNPIRVGWELELRFPDTTVVLKHWSDAGFLSVHMGHVFGQIPSIYGQGFSVPSTPAQMTLTNGEPHGWVSIIGTNGVMKQKSKPDSGMIDFFKQRGMTDEQIAEELKKRETSKVKTKWAVMKWKD